MSNCKCEICGHSDRPTGETRAMVPLMDDGRPNPCSPSWTVCDICQSVIDEEVGD